MEHLNEVAIWLIDNGGFKYYLNSHFISIFDNCEIRYNGLANIEILYNKYIILDFVMESRSIKLVYKNYTNDLVQKKLRNEYIHFFNLDKMPFTITQHNMIFVLNYMESVKKKIDAGFERYSMLLKENIKTMSSEQLQIGINNAFSLGELEELINAYNNLYSILYFACEYGIEKISYENIHEVKNAYNMVLESIHIGSDGLLVAVGAGLIVEIVKSFVKSVYDGNNAEIEKQKNELIQIETDLSTRQYVFHLINMLDSYLKKRECGCNTQVLSYIEQEINIIVKQIETLQGTKHIDTFV